MMKVSIESHLLHLLPSPVCVFSATPPYALQYANAAAEDLLGGSTRALRGSPANALFFPAEHLIALIERAAKQKSLLREFDMTLQCAGHTILHSNIQLLPLEESGEILFMLEKQGEVTTLHQHMRSQSETAQSAANMASILAHEIKNPLAGIRGAAQLLGHTVTPEDQKLTQLICDEVDRIGGLINEMEVFSDTTPIRTDAVNIHEVLHHVRILAENGWAKGIVFREVYDPSIPEVLGNKNLLIQLVINLVKNAAEAFAVQDNACITLSTHYQSGVHFRSVSQKCPTRLPVMVCIEDNGPGIPPAQKEHIFEPFVTTKEGGKGLGLAIAAKIVADHHGALELDNTIKSGTRFKILLPAA